MSNCKLNPTLKRTYDRDTISKRVKNAAQRKRENNPYKFKIKEFNIECARCGKEFSIQCTQRDYDNGNHRRYCSSFCSHSRKNSEDVKKRISQGVKNYLKNTPKKDKRYRVCVVCGKEFEVKVNERKNGRKIYSNATTCSEDCYKKLLSIKNKEVGAGGFREGSAKNYKHGYYEGIKCDSSWELAFVIWHKDKNISIDRCNQQRKYIYKGVEHKYYPDFIVNNQDIYEIKGIKDEMSDAKQYYNEDVIFLYKNDMKKYIDYCIEKYGKDFIKMYKE